MDKNELYTSLSRTTKFDFVHVGTMMKEYFPFEYTDEVHELKPRRARFGYLYEILLEKGNEKLYYVGSVLDQTIDERYKQHLNDTSDPIYAKVKDGFIISVKEISQCPLWGDKHECKAKLYIYEKEKINEYVNSCGRDKVLNIQFVDEEAEESETVIKPIKSDIQIYEYNQKQNCCFRIGWMELDESKGEKVRKTFYVSYKKGNEIERLEAKRIAEEKKKELDKKFYGL